MAVKPGNNRRERNKLFNIEERDGSAFRFLPFCNVDMEDFDIAKWYEENIRPYFMGKKFPFGQPITEPLREAQHFADENVFKRCEITYSANVLYGVLYQPNFITYSCLGNTDNSTVVSFQFSGCYMAKFKAEDSNYYACHIYSTNRDYGTNRTENWNTLYRNIASNIQECTLFKPIEAKPDEDNFYRKFNSNRNDFFTCGIIDKNNICFTLLLNQNNLKVVSEGCCCSKTYYAREMRPIFENTI